VAGRRTAPRSARIARDAEALVDEKQFYGSVLDKAELIEADEIEGIDREISLMRVQLRDEMKKGPIDHELMLKFVDRIVRAVVQRYRMSPQRGEEMAVHVKGLIDGLAESLFGAA
jgi:hypothetical protein